MSRTSSLAAHWVAFYQLPANPVREDRRQHVLDLHLGSVRSLDSVQPFLNLHGLHAAGNTTVPIASLTRFIVPERLRLLSSTTRPLLRANSSRTVRGNIS